MYFTLSKTKTGRKHFPMPVFDTKKIEQQTYHPSSEFRSRIGIKLDKERTTKTYYKGHIT